MGLLRYLLRKERIYTILVGFTIFYVTWSFLTSQQSNGIDLMRREKLERGLMNQRIQDQLIISDVTRRKLQIKKVESPPKSSADQYDDEEDHIATSIRQEEPEDSIAPLIKIVPPSYRDQNPQKPQDQRRQEIGTKRTIELYGELPKPRDSAFNERMKFSDFAPEGGNALPNYFIHAERMNRTRSAYGDSIVTYLHHNKAAGTSVKDCLRKVSLSQKRRISLLDSNGRVSTVKRLKQSPNLYHYYMGGYAFGICQQLDEPCSYFTFVRDPYERVISSYSYCRRAGMDQLCQPGDPWKMDIKEWVLFQGSFLFRQILFRPEFCLLSVPRNALKGGRGVPVARARSSVPCWYREKVQLKEKLNRTTEDDLIDYVVSNLDKWFAVIGVTEEYDTSLAMLEEAYGIPFHSRCSGKKINVSDYRNLKEKSSANETEQDVFIRETKAELMADEEVRSALRADLRIYDRAKLIFEKQREKYKQIHNLSDGR